MSGKRKPITWDVNAKGCHLCTSHAVGTHGYPLLWKNGRNQNMHRVLYEEAHNVSLPSDVLVRHTCDDRLCINLKHLITGTTQDNTRDRVERGRNNPPVGERSGTSKLTEKQVKKIRKATGPQSAIAKRYDLNQSQVSRIKTGERWAHL